MRWPWSKPLTVTEALLGKSHVFMGRTPEGRPLVRVMQPDGSFSEIVFDGRGWSVRTRGNVTRLEDATDQTSTEIA